MGIRNIFNRVWSIFAFGLSLYLCGCLNQNVEVNCEYASFEGKLSPVWSIPFPAVTICPETKSYKEKLNISDAFHRLMYKSNMTEEELLQMQSVLQICDGHLSDMFKLEQEFASNEIYSIIKDLAPDMFDTLMYCKWRNRFGFCRDYYKPVLTEEGLCFTFNALSPRDIYTDEMAEDMLIATENENSEDGFNQTNPYRVYGAGAKSGLFTLLRSYEQNTDYICRGPVQGYKVLLHNPAEVPQISKRYFRVPLAQEVLVSVKPQVITTSEKLRDYSAAQRQCYFKEEQKLRFFKVYTQNNCELECLSNFTKSLCGCVKFSMPRDADTPICGFDKIKCYQKAEGALQKKVFAEGLKNEQSIATGCNCLPSCTSISYDAEVTEAGFDWVPLFKAFKNPLDEFPGMQASRLSIFFKEPHFMTMKRSEIHDPTEVTQTVEFLGSENIVEDSNETDIPDNLVWDDPEITTEGYNL